MGREGKVRLVEGVDGAEAPARDLERIVGALEVVDWPVNWGFNGLATGCDFAGDDTGTPLAVDAAVALDNDRGVVAAFAAGILELFDAF